MRGRWGLMLVLLLVAVGGCAARSGAPAAPTTTLGKLVASQKILLGFTESLHPLLLGRSRADPVGYSVELCNHIVADLQRRIPGLRFSRCP